MNPIVAVVATLILAKWATELWLLRLNRDHVLKNAGAVPDAFKGIIEPATYARSVEYTLAKSRFHQWELLWGTVVLLAVLFSGVLPQGFDLFAGRFGASIWSMAAFLFTTGLVLSLASLPFDWYAQFRLEERFGFNTTTQRLWWLDRAKGLLLAMALGLPLLALLLKLAERAGAWWWLWAWAAILFFQLLMLVLAPVLILPLFNKFTPLPEGGLRERLLALAERTGFRARGIQVMDGSKRSRHSNAFFTGFGRFRKIVLFDTLIEQLQESELAAVLAHEIGHYKKGHIPKMLVWSAVSLLAGLYALAWLARQDWFYLAFGFEPGHLAPAFLLFGLLAGAVTFWLTPLANLWSRRFEYQADAFAARAMEESTSLVGALRKLNEKNLSNLTPHPLYSGFYYSHPTLLEREQALAEHSRRKS
jgi:STE24 endopeptidase